MDELRTSTYKDLLVWQKGITLVNQIYQMTSEFPAGEKYGIIAQMRRAAVSLPSNIAEGQARRSTGEFVQFLSPAEGSWAELETQIVIAMELGYCSKVGIGETLGLTEELRKMLNGLRRKLGSHR